MSTLVKKVKGLDKVDLVGASIGLFLILPSLVLITIDVLVNGSNML